MVDNLSKVEQFVYDQVLSGALEQGVKLDIATSHAEAAVIDYRQDRLNPAGIKNAKRSVGTMIIQRIKMAKKSDK